MPLQSDKLRLLRRIPDIRFEEETRGYSKDQVDRVLANLAPLADEIERIQARLAEAETRAASAEARLVEARSPSQANGAPGMPPAPQPDFDETLRNTLVSAQRQADTTIREAKEEAERLRTEAEFQSNAMLADARDQSAEMTTEAVAYRERLMAEVASERSKLLDEARDEAQGRVGEVEKELAEAHEAERAKLVSQIDELQDTHRLLQDDVVRFEQHLKARTTEVRAALDDITLVLDDPERLRATDGIEPADIEEFVSDDYPPIAVEVVALNDLEAEAQMAAEATSRPGEVLNAADLEDLALEEAEDEEEYVYGDPDTIDNMDTADVSEAVDAFHDNGVDADVSEGVLAADEADDYFDDDPQIGVETQVVTPEMLEGHTILNLDDQAEPDVSLPPPPGPADSSDSFVDQLRAATSDEPRDGDPISDFLNDKQDRGGGGWFGRRK